MKTFLKVLLWIGIIGVAIFIALYIASVIGKFNTIWDMFLYIWNNFQSGALSLAL